MTATALTYTFLSPARIEFGWGKLAAVGQLAATLGRRAFLVTGSRTLQARGVADQIETSLREAGVELVPLGSLTHEPEVADVDRVVAVVREHNPAPGDFVLGVGGGSALDLAKAVAALATNRQGDSVADYLEGVGRCLPLTEPPLPMLAIPTTSGTGSEATKNAVISSYDPPYKKSLRADQMLPRVVLVDPELMVTVPPSVTAHTGMDAITQLIESYISRRAQPIPQALCLAGLQGAAPALVEAFHNGQSRPARERLAQAALLSGLALANSGLGLAHGVAAALGSHCRVTHGLACAVMLPAALRFNAPARPAEILRLAEVVTGRHWSQASDAADALIAGMEELCGTLGIPRRLRDLGVRREQLPELVRGSRGNSLSTNPRDITDEELKNLLEEML